MYVLVDTSVWIDHFRKALPDLVKALEDGRVLTHPDIIGELACGTLHKRDQVLVLIGLLPKSAEPVAAEKMAFLQAHRLFGKGIGWVDVGLLAAAALTGCRLWTRDKRLRQAAHQMDLAYL